MSDAIVNLREELHTLVIAQWTGELTDAQHARLEHLLTANEQARRAYIELMHDAALLHQVLHVASPASPSPHKTPCDAKSRSALTSLYSFFAQPTPLSLTVAALVVGLFVTAMAFVAPPFYRAIVDLDENERASAGPVVAELSRVHGAVWADGQTAAYPGAQLRSGQRMRLVEGLAEIRFAGGVEMIVKAPADVVVEDDASARLNMGSVSATVPETAIGFSVVTPHAKIVDLGTQFGAIADAHTTQVHVFRGSVEASLLAPPSDNAKPIRLSAGESWRWNQQVRSGQRDKTNAAAFALSLPRPQPLPIVSTGRGIAPGEGDPRWQVVAPNADGVREAAPAIVTTPDPAWLSNDAARSQWISIAAESSSTAADTTYTFRTQFDMANFDPDSALIVGKLACDDTLAAIRLNGQAVEIPENPGGFSQFNSLRIAEHFVEGVNTLEFDVQNGPQISPMGFRMELIGRAFRKTDSNRQDPGDVRGDLQGDGSAPTR